MFFYKFVILFVFLFLEETQLCRWQSWLERNFPVRQWKVKTQKLMLLSLIFCLIAWTRNWHLNFLFRKFYSEAEKKLAVDQALRDIIKDVVVSKLIFYIWVIWNHTLHKANGLYLAFTVLHVVMQNDVQWPQNFVFEF